MNIRKSLLVLATLSLVACSTTSSIPNLNSNKESFKTFYAKLRKEAEQRGHNPAQLDAAFAGNITPIEQVLGAEKAQPELVRTFAQYTGSMLSAARIAGGMAKMAEHAEDLTSTNARTGVSPSVVVALWGIETNFGKVQGKHPIIPALATLAWQSPRSDYFRKETFAALKVVEKTGKNPAELLGSWAGAMGQCQFMPSSYLAYATDGDGDGKADIWSTEADVLASAATYLSKRGWQKNQPWRYALTEDFNAKNLKLNTRGLSDEALLSTWKDRGFKLPKGVHLSSGTKLRYYKPQEDGPAYLLGPNFSVILSWNNSSYFAWSVLSLAETLETETKQAN